MVQKPIAMSAITPVAVAAILILGILAAISTTKQAFAWTEEIQGGYKTNARRPADKSEDDACAKDFGKLTNGIYDRIRLKQMMAITHMVFGIF